MKDSLRQQRPSVPHPRVAVVGAGIAGLICARTLSDRGCSVTVFEKSRGVGGRMATRRIDTGAHFDHGAQYFTVRDVLFQRYVDSWIQEGAAAAWDGRICTLNAGRYEWKERTTPRYVGVPGMNAVCRRLAAGLDIRFQTRVRIPQRIGRQWRLTGEGGDALGDFDCFITSAPASQSAELLGAAPQLQQVARSTNMQGCWAVMLAFPDSLRLPFDGAFVLESPLSWIARDNSKPGRTAEQETWVLHASPQWTSACLDDAPESVLPKLVDAFWGATGQAPTTPAYSSCHRWRFAIPPEPCESRALFDEQLCLGACGDWCGGPRVEGAFLSGCAAAERVLAQFALLD